MKHVFLVIILGLSQFIFSQETHTIRGTVKDFSNGETVFGASVFLKGTTIGTTTNEYGFYSITAPKDSYTLIISYVGFEDIFKEINLNTDQTLNFEIKESETLLDEVIINADEPERVNIKKPQMSVSKLNSTTIKKMPAVLGEVDVIKSIQMLPGVTNSGEGSAGFNVRGGAADQNLVLLDEAIIYNTSHFFGFFSVFNTDAIKDIKLYKGDIPAKFGGRVSSVLDIRQKDGNSKKFTLNGGIGLISSRLAAEAPLFKKKGSFLIAGRTSYAHLFMPLIEAVEDSKLSFYDINLKTNYEINENNRVYLSGYFGRDIFDISSLIKNQYGNTSANLRWNHVYNDKLFSNLSLIYSKYDYQIILDFIQLDWVADINNYNLKYDLGYYINEKIKLDFGVSGILYNLNPGEIKPTDETSPINYLKLEQKRAFESGVYVSAEHKITDKLTAQYGLRYSRFSRLGGQYITTYIDDQPLVYNSLIGIYEEGEENGETFYEKSESIKTFNNLEPRLGLSYQLNDFSSVKASYTRTSQYLHLLSNTASVTPLDVWTPSGKYIKPQQANQYAIGYYRNINDSKYSIELETYYKTTDNRIDYVDGSDLIGNNNIETEILNGEARAYGLEVMLRKNEGKLTGWLAYTWSKSEQKTTGGKAGGPGINNGKWYNTPYDRTHDVSLTGIYNFSKKWDFSANLVYQTGRPVTYPNSQYIYEDLSIASYSGRNESRLPAYHRLDLSATYIPNSNIDKRWKGEWVFGIYNLYNRKNAASISFNQNEDTGVNEATRTAIFGIIPSVTYNFKF
ncbi:TonB-dependent receptor [Winogradskyella bathintestinalis]|uniref:TonB-dependent receptor n=1 Tax=Winogradskyella bathintestinalis TaxID=3035208 RepID=A0ABT7ZR84_9FLAO|nr:TonB-dependent receptor [Winogradskyella bathintestinalis]MDN3491521.1 TonB-dependent receptor [Winogradskyella bathintestinalis]